LAEKAKKRPKKQKNRKKSLFFASFGHFSAFFGCNS